MINPLIPMLAITGKPTKEDIKNAVARFSECGFEQLMLYPRDGCELSYMTDEWFSVIGAFLDAGREHNISFWLYDEFNYPSGGCRGTVMAKGPDYCVTYLKAKIENGCCEPQLLHNEKCPNVLSPDAMNLFVESTHEKYKERFGEYFGKQIKGIFTDEPSFFYGVWEPDELPFYPEMPDEYATLTGKDFYEDYRAFYLHAGAENFLGDCYKLLAERMNMAFVKRISDWCRENGLYMTGHLMSDDYPAESTRANGDLLRQLRELTLPCIDDIFSISTKPRLQMSLSAIQYASRGHDGAGAELFALGPCDISFAKMRMMIWYAALFGVSNYFLAISHLDVRGNAYRKFYFNDFSSDNPCAFAYRQFGEEAKLAAMMGKKDYAPEVYLRFPRNLSSDDLIGEKKADTLYAEILTELRKNQVQYLLIADEAVVGRPVIEIAGEGYTMGGAEYSDASSVAAQLRGEGVYTLHDGTLSEDIMVRRFADGTEVVLNLTDKEIELVHGTGTITLAPYGVNVAGEVGPKCSVVSSTSFDNAVYKAENVSALTITDSSGVCEIEVTEDVDVRLAVRCYPEELEVLLDGERVICGGIADTLPQGFSGLYKQTERMTLTAGCHTISVVGGIKNFYKYLPEVFVTGDFFKRGNVISTARFEGKTPARFGRFSCETEISLPQGSTALEICGTDKPVTLLVDGTDLGTRVVAPYIWTVPADFSGKSVTVRAESASDMSPMFGDTAKLEALDGTPVWCRGYCPEFEAAEPRMELKILKIED